MEAESTSFVKNREELKVTLSLQSTRTINCHTLKPQKRGGVSLLKEGRHEKIDVLTQCFESAGLGLGTVSMNIGWDLFF